MQHKKKKKERKKLIFERLIKDRIIRDIRIFFEKEEKYYYKSERVNNFLNNNYNEYETNGDKKNLSLIEYFNKTEH